MQTFLVTLIKARNCLKTRCRAHKAQSATIAVAKLNPGWVVVDVMAIGLGRGGSMLNTASPRQSSNSQVITAYNIRTNPSIKATMLILDPNELRQFRESLDERQSVRIAAKLPLLDVEAEVMQMIHWFAQAEYRDRLRPLLAATLATTKANGGMVATLRRHREAQCEAQDRLYHAEGLLPP